MKKPFYYGAVPLFLILAGTGPRGAPQDGDTLKITFSSFRAGNYEIYAMNADGSAQTRLTDNPSQDTLSAFSPDGSRITFHSHRDGNGEVHMMNADGSNVVNLTNDAEYDSHAKWMPDGRRIVFITTRHDPPQMELYTMNADGSNQTRLTNSPGDDWMPAISPDGTKIVWSSQRTGGGDLYIMNSDGSNATRLTDLPGAESHPYFSRDGSKVYFDAEFTGSGDIYVINVDGTGLTRITDGAWTEAMPSVSPDNSRLALSSHESGDHEIYTMNTDGTNKVRLTFTSADNLYASYSPGDLLPHRISLLRGFFGSGALDDVFRSDDARYVAGPSVLPTSAEAPIQILLNAISPLPSSSALRFKVESQVNVTNITQKLSLWDYTANEWVEIDSRPAGLTDSSTEVTVTQEPNRFIQPNTSNMRALISFKESRATPFFPWFARVDLATLKVSP